MIRSILSIRIGSGKEQGLRGFNLPVGGRVHQRCYSVLVLLIYVPRKPCLEQKINCIWIADSKVKGRLPKEVPSEKGRFW